MNTHIIEIATITYRSGPEWDQRFGRKLRVLPDAEIVEQQQLLTSPGSRLFVLTS
jgi:homoserine acetyltransferase